VLQRLGEQATQHTGGVQRQRQGAGIGPQPGGQYHQRRPHQFRNGPQGIEYQARGVQGQRAIATGCRQRQRQPEQRGQQGAQRRHGQGFQRTATDGGQVRGGKVRGQEAAGVFGHLAQPVGAGQVGELQIEEAEGPDDRQQQGGQQQAIDQARHV